MGGMGQQGFNGVNNQYGMMQARGSQGGGNNFGAVMNNGMMPVMNNMTATGNNPNAAMMMNNSTAMTGFQQQNAMNKMASSMQVMSLSELTSIDTCSRGNRSY